MTSSDSDTTPQLHLHLLGQPRVLRADGDDAGLPLGKPLAALCYIALESTRVTRDDLASILWSGAPESRGRQSVRQALWMLRKAAGDEIVVEVDGVLELGPNVATDLDTLAAALAAGDVDAAWEEWRGGPLQRLAVPDSAAFQGWVDEVRSRWEVRMGEVLLARAEAEAEPDARLPWLDRAIEVQPFSETLHAARVRTLVELRDVEGAGAALDHARAVVDEASPGLFDALSAQLRALRRTRYAEAEDDEHLVPEFVGRAEEFSRLAALWRSALSGRPRTAALIGPMGIGKTRLAEEFLALAESDGARIASVKAVETERTLELGVAGTLVRDLLKMPGGAGISAASSQALQHLVPSSGNGVPPTGPPPSPAALADAVEDLIEAVAHEVPLVVMVDDLQWVDPASRTLFLRIARTLRNARALVLFTSRTEEGDAGALRALRAMEEQQRAAVVELGVLSESEIDEMVALLLADEGLSDTSGLANLVARVSGGVPLVAVELLRSLVDRGILVRQSSRWHLADGAVLDSVQLPGTIQELFRARLAQLDDNETAVLAALGRRGTATAVPALEVDSGLTPVALATAVARLESRGLVRSAREGTVELAHDSLRAPVRDLLAAPAAGATVAARSAAPAPAGPSRGAFALLAAAVVVLFALALQREPAGGADPGPPPPVGWIGVNGIQEPGVTRIGFDADGEPIVERFDLPTALTGSVTAVRITPEGDTVWIAARGSQEVAPDVIEVRSDGRVDTVLAGYGDQTPALYTWSSRWALVNTQDSLADRFRHDLVLADRQTRTTRTLLRPGHVPAGVDLSADGTRLVTLAETLEGPDSVVVLTPSGRVVQAMEVERHLYEAVRWCGSDWFAVRAEPGRLPDAVVIEPSSGSVSPLALPEGTDHRSALCSPDGRHVAVVDAAGRRLMVLDRADLSVDHSITLPSRSRLAYWYGDSWRSLPTALELPDTVLELGWGDGARLRARARLEDGSIDSSQVTLRSLDPEVLSTTRDSVYGIRPGVGRVEVSARDWLLDTLTLTVTGEGSTEALLLDPLTTLDPTVWPYKLGDGFARPAVVDGERVLEVGSDPEARYVDGLASRELYPGPEGLTVELDFRIAVSRIDKQGIDLVVAYADPPGDPAKIGEHSHWIRHSGVSVKYPGDELGDQELDMVSLVADGVTIPRVPLPGFPRSGDAWTRLTIQVAPDGLVSVFVDGKAVPMERVRTEVLKGRPRVMVFTRAVDTNLYIRNLAVWPGVRYTASEPGEEG